MSTAGRISLSPIPSDPIPRPSQACPTLANPSSPPPCPPPRQIDHQIRSQTEIQSVPPRRIGHALPLGHPPPRAPVAPRARRHQRDLALRHRAVPRWARDLSRAPSADVEGQAARPPRVVPPAPALAPPRPSARECTRLRPLGPVRETPANVARSGGRLWAELVPPTVDAGFDASELARAGLRAVGPDRLVAGDVLWTVPARPARPRPIESEPRPSPSRWTSTEFLAWAITGQRNTLLGRPARAARAALTCSCGARATRIGSNPHPALC